MNTNTILGGILPRASRSLIACVAAAGLLSAPAFAQVESESYGKWVVNPKHVGASIDFGQIQNGYVANELENFAITRTGVYMAASGTYDDRLDVSVVLGGLFWFVAAKETDPVRRLIRFGSGGEAQGTYYFGGKEDPHSKLQAGLFPIKYSPSHNLGEYLYRSGAYPSTLTTGGWSYMNAAAYQAQGVRYTLPTLDGLLTHDLTLFMERDITPLNDFSPGYYITAKPTPFVEIGAGVVWSHALSVKPSRLSPKVRENAYSKNTDMPVFGADVQTPLFDANGNFIGLSPIGPREQQTLQDWADCQAGDCSDIGYYTFRGLKTALRATLDVGALVSDAIPAGTFRVYGEAALLGVQNQPFYYEDRMARMPVMLGIDLPTFGVLNRLSFEGEYLKSQFRNTIYAPNANQLPLPLTPSDASGSGGYGYIGAEEYTKDDIRWSVYAQRKIVDGLTIFAQAASDHMRHPDFWGVMSDESATRNKREWYYLVRVDFGF